MKIAMIIFVSVSAATYVIVALMFFLLQKRIDAELPDACRGSPLEQFMFGALWPVPVAYLVYQIFRMVFRL